MTRQQKKEAGLIVVTLIYSLLFFWWLAVSVDPAPHVIIVIILFLLGLLWAAFTAVTLSLSHSKYSLAILLLGIPLSVVVAGLAHLGAIAAGLLLFLSLSSAQRRLAREIKNRVKYNTAHTYGTGTRMVLLGLLIVVTGFMAAPLSTNFRADTLQVPQSVIHIAVNSLPSELANSEAVGQYINQNLNNLMTRTTPLMTTLIALLAFLLAARLLVPVLLWPTLGLIALLIHLAQKSEFLFLVTLQEPVERLQL